MKVVEIKKDDSIERVVKSFTEDSDDYEYILLVAIRRDGSQVIMTSNCNAIEKSFMTCTVNAWMSQWFKF